jgi:SulP family sulfate permease
VTGIDSSAMLSISKLKQLASRQAIHLVFTGLSPLLEQRLVREGLGSRESDRWHIFPEQDMGLAWCEEQLIARWESVGLASRPQTIRRQWMELVESGEEEGETNMLAGLLKGQSGRRKSRHDEDVHTARLQPYLEQRSLEAGETLVEESERFEGLILVESGQVMVQAIAADGSILQVKVMEAGNIVGDLGQYARRISRLAVIATEPALVYILTAEKIKQMEKQDPPLAIALHRLVAGILSERNTYLDDMVQALQF